MGGTMPDQTARFAFLTLPTPTEPVLNISVGDDHRRYRISRDQLYNLNSQIADALLRGHIREENAFRDTNQLALNLSAS
jgi:hypothetical protein